MFLFYCCCRCTFYLDDDRRIELQVSKTPDNFVFNCLKALEHDHKALSPAIFSIFFSQSSDYLLSKNKFSSSSHHHSSRHTAISLNLTNYLAQPFTRLTIISVTPHYLNCTINNNIPLISCVSDKVIASFNITYSVAISCQSFCHNTNLTANPQLNTTITIDQRPHLFLKVLEKDFLLCPCEPPPPMPMKCPNCFAHTLPFDLLGIKAGQQLSIQSRANTLITDKTVCSIIKISSSTLDLSTFSFNDIANLDSKVLGMVEHNFPQKFLTTKSNTRDNLEELEFTFSEDGDYMIKCCTGHPENMGSLVVHVTSLPRFINMTIQCPDEPAANVTSLDTLDTIDFNATCLQIVESVVNSSVSYLDCYNLALFLFRNLNGCDCIGSCRVIAACQSRNVSLLNCCNSLQAPTAPTAFLIINQQLCNNGGRMHKRTSVKSLSSLIQYDSDLYNVTGTAFYQWLPIFATGQDWAFNYDDLSNHTTTSSISSPSIMSFQQQDLYVSFSFGCIFGREGPGVAFTAIFTNVLVIHINLEILALPLELIEVNLPWRCSFDGLVYRCTSDFATNKLTGRTKTLKSLSIIAIDPITHKPASELSRFKCSPVFSSTKMTNVVPRACHSNLTTLYALEPVFLPRQNQFLSVSLVNQSCFKIYVN